MDHDEDRQKSDRSGARTVGINPQPAASGTYPLHTAIQEGNMDVARLLLEHGASPTIIDSEGRMPLLEAAMSGREDLTALLCRHTDPSDIIRHHSVPDGSHVSILHHLAVAATGPIFTLFLRLRPNLAEDVIDGASFLDTRDSQLCRTPLHCAVKSGNLPVASVLVREGASVNVQDSDGHTPLHLAALSNDAQAWDLLIDSGASVSIKNNMSLTPLAAIWDRKRLDWDSYEENPSLSRGMQENTKVLTKKLGAPRFGNPQHMFEKRYDLTRYSKQDLGIVKKALGRENSIHQRLNHPNIVSYYGCKDIEKDMPRLYLEYCDGGDLRDDMRSSSPPPTPAPMLVPTSTLMVDSDEGDHFDRSSLEDDELCEPRTWSASQVWKLIYQLYSALAHLHYGVSVSAEHERCVYEPSWDPTIHRDINPRNVVLSKRTDGEWDAKICDLGIARGELKDKMTLALTRGSIHYQPPELSKMQWSPKGDVWALAKTIHGLRRSFKKLPGAMERILEECRDERPDARPSSLTVLELAHQHVDATYMYPSLERELELAGRKSLIFHAFLSIARQMDSEVPFMPDAAIAHRSRQVNRLGLLLHDGALDEFEADCRDLQLAVLFAEYVEALKKARENSVEAEAKSQSSPTARQDMLERLLNRDRLNPDQQWPRSGWTALHIAAQQGNENMVRRLLERKANVSRRDAKGWTARQYPSRIRALWAAKETEATRNLDLEKSKRRPDQSRLYVLGRQLSSIQAKKKTFKDVEEILRRAEDAEAQESSNTTAVNENSKIDISQELHYRTSGPAHRGAKIQQTSHLSR